MEIDYKNMKVKVGDEVLDLYQLSRISRIYQRFCTAEYLIEISENELDPEFAFHMANYIRNDMENICTCESDILSSGAIEDAKEYAKKMMEGK